jgi:hypothetical protein
VVTAMAERFGATPFDIDDAFWSHRGETRTFDTMLEEFALRSEPLLRLALTPQSAGLLAASLGLSRMFRDDLEQLDAGLQLYDAFYRWCRDATGESHNWPTVKTSS